MSASSTRSLRCPNGFQAPRRLTRGQEWFA
jgi:hypothetical protein